MYVEFAAAVFLICSQQHVVDVLAVASLSTSSAAAAAWQIYSAKTKYVNIVMYIITMPIPLPLRVVMTEPSIHPSVRPSVRPSIRLSVCLSVCLSIYIVNVRLKVKWTVFNYLLFTKKLI